MEIKEVKNNGGGGVTRSSSINLNSINEKVRTVEGTARVTPISMKNLNDRIDNLIANQKNFKVIDISKYGVQARDDGKPVLVPVEYTITPNTTIIGNFIFVSGSSTKGSNVPIVLTKGNFSVRSICDKDGTIYSATLYRENNKIYLKMSGVRCFPKINTGSHLLFTDDL